MTAQSLPDSSSDLNHLFRLELGFYEVFHTIARRTKVFFTIPETIVMGFGFLQPTLLCTDYETGELVIRENISQKGLVEAVDFFEDLNKVKGNIPIGVHKLAATTYCKDTCKALMTAQEAVSVWSSHSSQSHAQLLQRYISGLSRKPALIRATWEGSKVTKQIITHGTQAKPQPVLKSFDLSQLTRKKDADSFKTSFFVYSKAEKAVTTDLPVAHAIDSKVMYLVTLLEKYYLPSSDLKIYSLEADFMQDEKGLW